MLARLCAAAAVAVALVMGGVGAVGIDKKHAGAGAGAADADADAGVDLDALSQNLFDKFESAKVRLVSLGNGPPPSSASSSSSNTVPVDFGQAFRAYPSSQAGVGPFAVDPSAVQMQLQQQLQQQQLLQQRARVLGIGYNAGLQQGGASAFAPPTSGGATPSVIPMGLLTAGFTAPVLPGVELATQLQMAAARQQQLASLQSLGSSRRAPSAVSADAAKDSAESIAKLANLTKAVQGARNNLTIASWRLQSAQTEKAKREQAAMEKNIEVFKMKASVAALTDRIEATTAEAEAAKAAVAKETAKVVRTQSVDGGKKQTQRAVELALLCVRALCVRVCVFLSVRRSLTSRHSILFLPHFLSKSPLVPATGRSALCARPPFMCPLRAFNRPLRRSRRRRPSRT
jgi:hypothetical protein